MLALRPIPNSLRSPLVAIDTPWGPEVVFFMGAVCRPTHVGVVASAIGIINEWEWIWMNIRIAAHLSFTEV